MKKKILDKEEKFHDNWATNEKLEDIMVDESFEAITAPENRFIIKTLGNLKGKKILDLGCGLGESSVYMAKKGGDVTATDISGEMLVLTKKLAKHHKTTLKTKKCYSHRLPFKDSTFDVVYAGNLLHHINIKETLKDVKRVLKKNGIFVSWDPLAHNFFINVYRKISSNLHTEDEHPLRIKDIKMIRKHFRKSKAKFTWFSTLWIFFKFLLTGVDPKKERYWKKILKDHKKIKKTYKRLDKLDRFILNNIPFLRRYCWNVTIIARK